MLYFMFYFKLYFMNLHDEAISCFHENHNRVMNEKHFMTYFYNFSVHRCI